jgi:hypothetical protein
MPVYAYIIDDNPARIWGLTSRQRKRRVLEAAGVTDIVDDIAAVPQASSVVLFRGDYLFDDRVINYMVQASDVILKIPQGATEALVAAHVPSRSGCSNSNRRLCCRLPLIMFGYWKEGFSTGLTRG